VIADPVVTNEILSNQFWDQLHSSMTPNVVHHPANDVRVLL